MNTYSRFAQLLFAATLLFSVVSCAAYPSHNSWNSNSNYGYNGYSSSRYDNDHDRDRSRTVPVQQMRAEYAMEVQKERAQYAQ